MSDIPMFSARGNTDAEKIAEMMSYLSNLSSAIDRELLSIDFSNLNSDLADRINKGITEHQDLSGFASKNYAKKNFTSFAFVNGVRDEVKGYTDERELETKRYVNQNFYTYNEVNDLINLLKAKIEELEEKVAKL